MITRRFWRITFVVLFVIVLAIIVLDAIVGHVGLALALLLSLAVCVVGFISNRE